jgi:hypothetical protein
VNLEDIGTNPSPPSPFVNLFYTREEKAADDMNVSNHAYDDVEACQKILQNLVMMYLSMFTK